MGGRKNSRWRTFVAQAAVLLLVLQGVAGVFACPTFAFTTNLSDAVLDGSAICSHSSEFDKSAPAQNPAKGQQHECPVCLSFVCHSSAILTPELVVAAPDTRAVFATESTSLASGPNLPVLHNRGPPQSFPA